jgi:hypothetical protein
MKILCYELNSDEGLLLFAFEIMIFIALFGLISQIIIAAVKK